MDAVDLIPRDRDGHGDGRAAGAPFVGLVGALVLVLVGAVLYVTSHNTVTSRTQELAQLTQSTDRWTAVANSYARYSTLAQQRKRRVDEVVGLAQSRFDWPRLLDQLAEEMPARAALMSMSATTPGGSASSASGSDSGSSPDGSGVQLAGCAASHSTVAGMMVALRRITGVSGVTLAQSSRNGEQPAGGDSASDFNGCPFGVDFQVTLDYAATAGGGTTAASGAASASASQTTGGGAAQ